MAPRWKGKGAEAKAIAEPLSKIMCDLQTCLVQRGACGLLSGCIVLIATGTEETDLLNRVCFGRQIVTVEKDKQWVQLSAEEAFYLCYSLKCLSIKENDSIMTTEALWSCMKSRKESFPYFCKAYFHLRKKNWVVRSGSQYGVDFVAYRHHPALVHSEFAILILSVENDTAASTRMKVWSDIHSTTRLSGSVAKTLLLLHISKNGTSDISPLCLDNYTVEERTITRWGPERNREE